MIIEFKNDAGKVVKVMALLPKVYKTGSKGLYASDKISVEGKRYQVSVILTEIGSKGVKCKLLLS